MKLSRISFLVLLLFLVAVSNMAQSRQRKPTRKTAVATYISSQDGSHRGEVTLKLNDRLVTFSWDAGTRSYPPAQSNPRGFQAGAEWRIIYVEGSGMEGDDSPYLLSATFTGRVLSENGKSLGKTPNSTSEQKRFKVFFECASNCNAEFISFIYGDNLRIDVSIGYSAFSDPSVGYNRGKTEKDYVYYRAPTERFVEKKSKQKANATLKKLLLDVYNLGVYCIDNDIKSGTFTETGKFKVLTKLRQQLKL